jgi:endoglucanase
VPRHVPAASCLLLGFLSLACLAPNEVTGGKAPSVRSMMHDQPPVPRVLVNQVGYLPARPKIATVRATSNDAAAPLEWRLVDGAGKEVARGKTLPFGADRPSGDTVQLVDFSSVRAPGDGYVLEVGGERSHPFAIRADLYHHLKYDALAYFYQNRSGVPITMPYAGARQWERPAGHLSDRQVPCLPAMACGYKLDVSGGWYDAGDHGKYVVNAGISVWTLLALHERLTRLGRSAGDFADGKMSIPEAGNGVPDLLDEARFELEWMLKMQVPEGTPLAGMAHHKIHDRSWTSLATAPHQDHEPRFLHPPSTAATLNLAAAAAQGARVFARIDPAFSARCLAAARRAWAAALAHPTLFAREPAQSSGGGPYDDAHVADEFYWAAAELAITTGEQPFREAMERSAFYLAIPTSDAPPDKPAGVPTSMTWQATAALGSLSLLIDDGKLLSAEARATLLAHLRAAADLYAAIVAEQGYRSPLRPGAKGYPWGSSAVAANNLLVVSLAYDLTKDRRYLDTVAVGFDYLLGRNPLDQSYVSGYGARPLEHPHHRFWARQYSFRFPPPPPGALAGGPNSGLQDPIAKQAKLTGCAPQKCYVDHIEAWSLNEVAINWNAPLAWVAAFLDETAKD